MMQKTHLDKWEVWQIIILFRIWCCYKNKTNILFKLFNMSQVLFNLTFPLFVYKLISKVLAPTFLLYKRDFDHFYNLILNNAWIILLGQWLQKGTTAISNFSFVQKLWMWRLYHFWWISAAQTCHSMSTMWCNQISCSRSNA